MVRTGDACLADTIHLPPSVKSPMTSQILVVDDNPQITNLLQKYLVEQGFAVATAGDGQEALRCVGAQVPDLILLDVMMPQMDGFAFMQKLRTQHDTPVIFLTARMEEIDLLMGFSLGADDYLTKPFSMSELTARVKAVLRRSSDQSERSAISPSGDIVIDRDRHRVTVQGEEINLTRTEFELLAALVESRGRVLSRAYLMERMFGDVYEVTAGFERTVDVHVKNLRAKIDPAPSGASYISTVYGVGYQLQARRE